MGVIKKRVGEKRGGSMTEWTSGLNGNERSEQRGGGVSGPHLSLVVWALIANTVLPESSPRFHSLSQSLPSPRGQPGFIAPCGTRSSG